MKIFKKIKVLNQSEANKRELTSIPSTLVTPYIWYKPHTISRTTVFKPGHRPPHVTMQATTSSASKATCKIYYIKLINNGKII